MQKPGLAFAGYYEYIKPWRVQIIGESETKYLQSLPPRLREKRVRDVAALDVSCFIVTKGITPLEEFRTSARSARCRSSRRRRCRRRRSPAPRTSSKRPWRRGSRCTPASSTSTASASCSSATAASARASARSTSIYRGHRLIADDMVIVRRHPNDVLLGYSNDLLRHHMELRGIGIIDIKDLFGVASTRDVKPIDLVVKLEKWVEGTEYDRLGIAGETLRAPRRVQARTSACRWPRAATSRCWSRSPRATT